MDRDWKRGRLKGGGGARNWQGGRVGGGVRDGERQ